jgi:predicted transcriptional regulator
MKRILLYIFLGLFVVAGAGVGFLWWKLRAHVEPIPAVLATIERDPASIRLPGLLDHPDLVVGELRGSIAYFVIESRESMSAGEGRELNLALNRWRYREGTKGFFIGDVEGLGFLKWKLNELAGTMQREARLPVYLDYDGAILHGFKLPKGHTAVVVLGETGEVTFRKSGKLTPADVEALRTALGATEPPPPPPAPAFRAGLLSTASCAGHGCALVFLSRPLSAKDVPGVEGGKAKDDSAAWNDADARLVALLSDRALPADKSMGVFVGTLEGIKLASGWSIAADDVKLRAAFEIGPAETAIVVVDREGRLALRERGRVAFWQLAVLNELLALPPRRAK